MAKYPCRICGLEQVADMWHSLALSRTACFVASERLIRTHSST